MARLAVESGAPVVPCAMIDTFQFQPPGRLRPNLRVRPGVRFGEPLDFSRYHGQQADAKLLRTITDEIMQAIQKLSGQEYVDVDARRAKAELAADHGQNHALTTARAPRFYRRLALQPSAQASGPLRWWPCEWESSPAAATAPG